MRLVGERRNPPEHARPVRCLHCRKFVPVLLFDSPAVGMACATCHQRWTELRKEAALLPRDLRARLSVRTKPVPCHRCQSLAFVVHLSDPVEILCPYCHDSARSLYKESLGEAGGLPVSR